MRISDWSSDVCSSDLDAQTVTGVLEVLESEAERLLALEDRLRAAIVFRATASLLGFGAAMLAAYRRHKAARALQIGRSSCRGRVGQYVEHSGVAGALNKKQTMNTKSYTK